MRTVVEVAYGTSQGTTNVHPGEFLVAKGHPGSGLVKTRKFDLGNICRLDFDDTWFAAASPPHPTIPPKRGRLDPSNDQTIKRRMSSALMDAKRADRLKIRKP